MSTPREKKTLYLKDEGMDEGGRVFGPLMSVDGKRCAERWVNYNEAKAIADVNGCRLEVV